MRNKSCILFQYFYSIERVIDELTKTNGSFAIISDYTYSHNTLELHLKKDREIFLRVVCEGCTYIKGPTEWSGVFLDVECLHGTFCKERYDEILNTAGNGPVFSLKDTTNEFEVLCGDIKIFNEDFPGAPGAPGS